MCTCKCLLCAVLSAHSANTTTERHNTTCKGGCSSRVQEKKRELFADPLSIGAAFQEQPPMAGCSVVCICGPCRGLKLMLMIATKESMH